MLQPNRHKDSKSYRYGFNGMEKDDELKGEGNSIDFGARMLDSRIGRWFTTDPEFEKNPSTSTYSYVVNNPIIFIDPNGENWFYYQAKGETKKTWHYHKGSEATYTSADGKKVQIKSDLEKLVLFEVTGRNQLGASTGRLKLYDQDKVIIDTEAFSGSRSIGSDLPKEENLYVFQLDKRSNTPVYVPNSRAGYKWHMGIQKIPAVVKDEEGLDHTINGAGYGFGRIRMVNYTDDFQVDYEVQDGAYLHGKAGGKDATWGCIADRKELIFNYFWEGAGKDYRTIVPVAVDRGNNKLKINEASKSDNNKKQSDESNDKPDDN